MIPSEHREFLEEHRLCVVGFCRPTGPPSLSPVYYVVDGEDILISTTATRAKGRRLRDDSDVTLCVLHEEFPFPYLNVYGRARVSDEGAVDVMARVGAVMLGAPLAEDARPALEERARREQRVVLRVMPQRFFRTTPIGGRARKGG